MPEKQSKQHKCRKNVVVFTHVYLDSFNTKFHRLCSMNITVSLGKLRHIINTNNVLSISKS